MRSNHGYIGRAVWFRLIFLVVLMVVVGILTFLSFENKSVDAENDVDGQPTTLPISREEWVNQSCHQGQLAYNNGDYREAVATLNRCVPYYIADLHFFIMRGQSWQALGKNDLARIDFEYVLRQDPEHEEALYLQSQLPEE